MTSDGPRERSLVDGRRVLAVLAVCVVLVGGTVGFFVGVGSKSRPIAPFGVVLFEPTPVGMALYGATAATVVVAALLAVVTVLSRFDADAA